MSRGGEAENFPSREPEKRLNLVMHENYMRREKTRLKKTSMVHLFLLLLRDFYRPQWLPPLRPLDDGAVGFGIDRTHIGAITVLVFSFA